MSRSSKAPKAAALPLTAVETASDGSYSHDNGRKSVGLRALECAMCGHVEASRGLPIQLLAKSHTRSEIFEDGRICGWPKVRSIGLSLRSSVTILKKTIHRCYCIYITLTEGKLREHQIVVMNLDQSPLQCGQDRFRIGGEQGTGKNAEIFELSGVSPYLWVLPRSLGKVRGVLTPTSML